MAGIWGWKRCVAVTLVLVLSLPLLLLVGCGGAGKGGIEEIELSSLVLQDSLALYYPVSSSAPARVPSYQVSMDLSNVVGIRDTAVSPGTARSLANEGFAVTQGGENRIYHVYQDATVGRFVTVDALMHSFHVLCDYALLEIERNRLLTDLRGLVASLYETMQRMLHGSQGEVHQAVLQDLAFLGVAARLLGVEVDIPKEVRDAVEKEIELVYGQAAWANSPVFDYREDYGQYRPQGHYAGDQDLEGYFRAMTWMGRMGFNPATGGTPTEIARGRSMTRQAILLVGALHMADVDGEPALQVWDRIYQPSRFLMGASDSLDVYFYTRLAEEVFGRSFKLSRLADDVAVDDFRERALADDDISMQTGVGETEGGDKDRSFRLFGKRFVPDTYIFQQLVAPKVAERLMPRGLDVPSALGSDRAFTILDNLYGDTKYEGYTQEMRALQAKYSSVDVAQERSSVYWSCVDALRPILKPCGDGYPPFMRGAAWQDRDLNAFLGSWAELRHGSFTLLESDKAVGGTKPGVTAKGYVEPRPATFASLAATVDMLSRGLSERGMAGAATERLDALYQLLFALKGIAEKELRNEPLTADEYQAIAGIGDTLQYLETFPVPGNEGSLLEAGSSLAQVIGVYSDPGYGEVLEAAVGRPALYYVIAPVDGRPTLTMGAGFTYYEFVESAEEQLDDEDWQEMLDAGLAPAPPAWTTSFTSQ